MGGDNQQATGWLAGLIDTDGTISIRYGANRSLVPFLSITNTNPLIIEGAVNTIHALGVGCHVSWQSNSRHGRTAKLLGYVQVTGMKRLSALLPNLELYAKRWRSELVMEYIEGRQALPYRSPYREIDVAIKDKLNSNWEPQRLHAMPSEDAWLAGVIDGDGALMIKNGAVYNGSIRQYPDLTIINSSPLLIGAVAHLLPEHKLIKKNNGPKATKPIFHLSLIGYRRAIPAVERLFPHLIGKKRQAELLLELWRYRQALPYRTPYGEYEMSLKAEIQALNHRGI